MISLSKGAVVAAMAFGSLALQSAGASAMPMVDIGAATVARSEAASGIEQARWVCGPFRCFRRPDYYGYGFYGGWHRGWRGYGWHRPFGWGGGWHRWHRW